MHKHFTSLEDVLKHFGDSNYVSNVVEQYNKYAEEISKKFDKALKESLEADVTETSDSFTLEYDLPGVSKTDVEILLDESKVTVKVSKKKGKAVNLVSIQHTPKTLDLSKAVSKMDNGVLTIKIPKADSFKSRSLKID